MAARRTAVEARAREAQRRMETRLEQLAAVEPTGGSDAPSISETPRATGSETPRATGGPPEVGDQTEEIGSVMVGRVKTASIDITLIDEDPSQYRKFSGPYSDENPGAGVPELADTIRSRGLLQPILVRRDEERYRLIVGARRLRAFRYLAGRFPDEGWTNVPAIIWPGPVTRATVIAMQIIENDARRNPDPASRRGAYLELRAELGGNARQAMRMLGIGHTTWYRVTRQPAEHEMAPIRRVGQKAASRTSIGQLTRTLKAYVDRVQKLEAEQAAQLERALSDLLDALRSRSASPSSPAKAPSP